MAQNIFVTRLPHVSTCGKRATKMSWYRTTTVQRQLIKGKHTGPKTGRNIIVIFQTLFWAGNCAKPFDVFVRWIHVEFFILSIGRMIKQHLQIKPLRRSWQENIRPRENPIFLRWKRTRKSLFLFWWILRRMWLSRLGGNFWGAQGPVVRTPGFTGSDT